MFIVEAELHCPQNNVHALLTVVLVWINLRYIIVPDDDAGLPELPQVLLRVHGLDPQRHSGPFLLLKVQWLDRQQHFLWRRA